MKNKYMSDIEATKLGKFFAIYRTGLVYALIEVCFRTGCRMDEVLRLRLRDINKEKGTIQIYRGSKGSNSRTCLVKEDLCYVLWDLGTKAGIDINVPITYARGKAFRSRISNVRWLERAWKKTQRLLFDHEEYGMHCFRHSYAKRLYMGSSHDLRLVQAALGHKALSSTAYYLNYMVMDENQDLLKKVGSDY